MTNLKYALGGLALLLVFFGLQAVAESQLPFFLTISLLAALCLMGYAVTLFLNKTAEDE